MACIRSSTVEKPNVHMGNTRHEDWIISNIVKCGELEIALKQATEWVARVDSGLSILTKEEQLILYRLYIHAEKNAVDQLCGELYIEKSQVYNKRNTALERFTTALYGYCET